MTKQTYFITVTSSAGKKVDAFHDATGHLIDVFHDATGHLVDDRGMLIVQQPGRTVTFAAGSWSRYEVQKNSVDDGETTDMEE